MFLFCPAAAGGALRLLRPPPASWTGLASLGNTVGMLGHVFDHQAPLTRPLEAVVVACSTSRRRWVQGDEHSRNEAKTWIFKNFLSSHHLRYPLVSRVIVHYSFFRSIAAVVSDQNGGVCGCETAEHRP